MAWIKLSDHLPPEGEQIILSGFIKNNPKNGRWVETGFMHKDGQFYGDHFDVNDRDPFYPPTHYMPLPNPPLQD